jgi:N-acetylated-alpha-linked acidic dipeptidase
MHAQYFGAVGAILYNDPADYAPFGTASNQVYNQKWYMPSSGAQRGSALISNGDPLTPIYPATGAGISTLFNKSTFFIF